MDPCCCTTSSRNPDVLRQQASRDLLYFGPTRQRGRSWLLGVAWQPASHLPPWMPSTAGQRGNSASAQPGQVHPPFASRGSGWLTAGTQLSGPLGAAVGSSLFHFPRYFEKTPFQDSQTCGHCTCLLNETQVTSAWGIKSLL